MQFHGVYCGACVCRVWTWNLVFCVRPSSSCVSAFCDSESFQRWECSNSETLQWLKCNTSASEIPWSVTTLCELGRPALRPWWLEIDWSCNNIAHSTPPPPQTVTMICEDCNSYGGWKYTSVVTTLGIQPPSHIVIDGTYVLYQYCLATLRTTISGTTLLYQNCSHAVVSGC